MVDIDIDTTALGLIGYPLGHSISPLIHNYALDKLDLNYVYLPFEIEPDQLKEGIQGLRSLKIKGINVTIPYKNDVIPYLDDLDPLAEQIGAVNTINNHEGKLKGYNTDASGFKKMLKEDAGFSIKGKKALIIGAGGASRAVGEVLCQNKIQELHIINRTENKARQLAKKWRENYPAVEIGVKGIAENYYRSIMERMDLIVDTTPVGMAPETDVAPVLAADCFHSNLLVVDLVYNPPETTILRAAKKAGAQTLNGLTMLLYQAVDAFKLWTGKEPEVKDWYQLVLEKKGW